MNYTATLKEFWPHCPASQFDLATHLLLLKSSFKLQDPLLHPHIIFTLELVISSALPSSQHKQSISIITHHDSSKWFETRRNCLCGYFSGSFDDGWKNASKSIYSSILFEKLPSLQKSFWQLFCGTFVCKNLHGFERQARNQLQGYCFYCSVFGSNGTATSFEQQHLI